MADLSKKEILHQLNKICSSNEFMSKKKLCKLFKYIIERKLEGNEELLKGYNLGIELFERPKSFKPENDPIVRIQVGRLRRSLELYYLKDGINDKIRIIIPKGGNIPEFIPIESGNLIAAKQENQNTIKKSNKPTITAIPFKNLTGDVKNNFFASGFTEEILNELTNYEDFQVMSFPLKFDPAENLETSKSDIQSLGADFIIEGSIRHNKTIVKISVKVIDASTNEHLWAEQYSRDLSAISMVELQEYIAQKIVVIIAGEYGIIPQKLFKKYNETKPKEKETYDAILRFYYYEKILTPQSALEARNALELAIKKEPNYGMISSMLATLYGNAYTLDEPGSETALTKMIDLANNGIKYDPNNQLVRIIYAWTFFLKEDRKRFFFEIEKALELNPNSPFRIGSIGFFISLYGDWERGKVLLDRAMQYNLGFPSWYYGVTSLYYYRKKDYLKAYEEALKYDIPGIFWEPLLKAICLAQLNKTQEAKKQINYLKTLKPNVENKVKILLKRFIKDGTLILNVIDGLVKAGLEVKN